jgi:hypothetical protein
LNVIDLEQSGQNLLSDVGNLRMKGAGPLVSALEEPSRTVKFAAGRPPKPKQPQSPHIIIAAGASPA